MLAILLILPFLVAAQDHKMTNTLLIDDFSAEQSALGTRWEGFSDRVMGGRSDLNARIVQPRAVFPWSYFTQEIPISTEWNTVYLPFSGFEAENLRANTVNAGKLNSIAIVAAKRAFTADLYVDSIFLYKK